jgi:hypothetical protein
MADRIQLRRDTAVNWAATNPILSSGEPGYDITNGILKVGDAVTAWNDLQPYSAFEITFGAKASSSDAGTLFQMAIDDDYLYICVSAGSAGNAKWKRCLLFLT